MTEALEAMSGLFLGYAALSTIFLSFFIWAGAKRLAKNKLSFFKSGIAAVAASFIIYSLSLIGYAFPKLNTLLGFAIGLILSLFILHFFLKVPLRNTAHLFLLNVIAQLLAVIIGTYLFVGGLADLWGII